MALGWFRSDSRNDGRAEGPGIHPALGNAQGKGHGMTGCRPNGPTVHPWTNGRPVGPMRGIAAPTPWALPRAGRTRAASRRICDVAAGTRPATYKQATPIGVPGSPHGVCLLLLTVAVPADYR